MSAENRTDKPRLRRLIAARRAALTAGVRREEAAGLARAWRTAVVDPLRPGSTVCAYVPSVGEPGSLEQLDDARAAGMRVLVPVTGAPGPLHWAEYAGRGGLRAARFGLLEPDGPVLGPDAVSRAAVALVPALAVDQEGVRLGRGGGYYDRSLPRIHPDARLVCQVRDDEFVDVLPRDPHDVRMHAVLTPSRGFVEIGNTT